MRRNRTAVCEAEESSKDRSTEASASSLSNDGDDDSIQFVRRWDYDFKKSEAYGSAGTLSMRLKMLACMVVFFVLFRVLPLLGLTSSLYQIFALVALAAVADGIESRITAWRCQRASNERLPLLPNQSRRLVCVGWPAELSAHGELGDEAFEPEVFSGTVAIRPRNNLHAFYVVMAVVGFCFALTCKYLVRHSLSHGGIMIEIAVGVGVAELAMILFWPVSLRLVPGRLDIIRFSAFSRKPKEIEKINLRKARIVVDLRKRFVVIKSPPYSREFSIELMPGRWRFAHTLFRAAMSTHEPGPLPDDALVG